MSKRLKILIVRFSSIGDIVLTSPVIRCLKEQVDCELHYLTKKSYEVLLEANPHVDRLHLMDKDLKTLIPILKAEDFDLIVDLHNSLRSWKLRRMLGVQSRTFYKANREKWLMVRFKIDRLPREHIVDRYLETVAHLGVRKDKMGLEFHILPKNKVLIHRTFPQLVDKYVVFAIGGQHATKKMPVEKIINVCKSLTLPIVLIGGKEDMEAGSRVEQAVGPRVVNACGQLNIAQSASVIEQSDLVITHDTGMMHIAAAFQKRIVSIWGNTIPEFGMYPYMAENNEDRFVTVEVKGLSCRPCSKIGFDKCPKGHFRCMQEIDVNRIIEKTNDQN